MGTGREEISGRQCRRDAAMGRVTLRAIWKGGGRKSQRGIRSRGSLMTTRSSCGFGLLREVRRLEVSAIVSHRARPQTQTASSFLSFSPSTHRIARTPPGLVFFPSHRVSASPLLPPLLSTLPFPPPPYSHPFNALHEKDAGGGGRDGAPFCTPLPRRKTYGKKTHTAVLPMEVVLKIASYLRRYRTESYGGTVVHPKGSSVASVFRGYADPQLVAPMEQQLWAKHVMPTSSTLPSPGAWHGIDGVADACSVVSVIFSLLSWGSPDCQGDDGASPALRCSIRRLAISQTLTGEWDVPSRCALYHLVEGDPDACGTGETGWSLVGTWEMLPRTLARGAQSMSVWNCPPCRWWSLALVRDDQMEPDYTGLHVSVLASLMKE